MGRGTGLVAEDKRTTRTAPEQTYATAVHRVLDDNTEELLWAAEVITGSRQAAEQCLAQTIELAIASEYVGQDWMLSWVKRLLVHVTLKRISGEIRELLLAAGTRSTVAPPRISAREHDRQKVRCIAPKRIVASLDVLERACFILHVYLAYPVHDCALLLGCPRRWIESICERVLANTVAAGPTSEDAYGDLDCLDSQGVTECAR